jgi:hypothetical protein
MQLGFGVVHHPHTDPNYLPDLKYQWLSIPTPAKDVVMAGV